MHCLYHCLTDNYINFPQGGSFNSIAGLQSILTLHKVKKIAARSALQFLDTSLDLPLPYFIHLLMK